MKKNYHLMALAIISLLFSTVSAQIVLTDSYRIFPDSKGNMEKIQQVSLGNYLVLGKAFGHGYISVLDKTGKEILHNPLRDEVGGIRSNITDMVVSTDGYYFIGDCDSCGTPGDPTRKILFLKTDKDLNVVAKNVVDVPTHPTKRYTVWGYQSMRQDGADNFLGLIQVHFEKGDTAYTDYVLMQVNKNLAVQMSSTYDFQPLDNIADLVVTSDAYYVLSWGIRELAIASDTMRLTRFTKATTSVNPQVVWQRSYRGVGFKSIRLPSGDWVIAGASTENLLKGPESALILTDGATGGIKKKVTFGTPLIDGIRDIKLLQNGDLLAAVVENARYPDSTTLNDFMLGLNAYPDSWPHPQTGKIMRFSSTTLETVTADIVFPNGDSTDIILRSVWPLTPDGTQFVACGQLRRKPLFYTRGLFTSALADNTKDGTNDDTPIAEKSVPSGGFEAQIFPNPVRTRQQILADFPDLQPDQTDLQLLMFDAVGRLVQSIALGQQSQIQFESPKRAGVYILQLRSEKQILHTKRFMVIQ